ncbi:hypothetical protein LTR95_004571 [Oleoguttula sp. CCFEE 5521]
MATPQFRSPSFPDPPQPSHQLIALLDQYLELKGVIFPRPGAISESSVEYTGSSSPSIPLSSHLDEHDNDLARAAALEPKIYQIYRSIDRHVRTATLQYLDNQYAAMASPDEGKAFAPMSITEKVTTLRLKQWERDNAAIAPPGGTFEVLVITGLDCQGSPVRNGKLHLSWSVTWPDASKLLASTISYALESLDQGKAADPGPDEESRWLVQWTEGGKAVTSEPDEVLASSADFEALTSRLIFELDGGVVLWHGDLWAESQCLRCIAKDGQAAMDQDLGDGDGDGGDDNKLGLEDDGFAGAGVANGEEEEDEMLCLAWQMVERGELSFDCTEK